MSDDFIADPLIKIPKLNEKVNDTDETYSKMNLEIFTQKIQKMNEDRS